MRSLFLLLVAALALPFAATAQTTVVDCETASAVPVGFGDLEVDGAAADDHAELDELSGTTLVNLTGCTFAAFNPFTEVVTAAVELSGAGVVPGGTTALLAGDLPDGPGALVLVQGDLEPGDSVADALAAGVVASVVYLNENTVFGSTSGGPNNNARRADSFDLVDMMRQVRLRASLEESGGDLVAAPNPALSAIRLGFTLEEGDEAVVLDALGREVRFITEAAGSHVVDLSTQDLGPGVYTLKVGAASRMFTVVR